MDENMEIADDAVSVENVEEELAGEAEDADAGAVDAGDEAVADGLERLLAEAERRGYLRARNEIAEAAMGSPRLWENPSRRAEEQAKADAAPKDAGLKSDFLRRVRPSVWD